MTLKEEILYNKNLGKSQKKIEDRIVNNFIKAIKEDIDTYGEDKVIELYTMIYGEELKEDFQNILSEGLVSAGASGGTMVTPSLLGKIMLAWNKIKGFFTGQISSISKIVSSGNWMGLLKLPIFQGALAAGGVIAVIAILKKIFGKKKIEAQEDEIKSQMKKAGYA